MDANDMMLPRRIERQLLELERHDADTVVGGGAIYIDSEGKVTGQRKGQ
jgi:hypothetical protein